MDGVEVLPYEGGGSSSLTAPAVVPRAAAASAWEKLSVSPISQGFSMSNCGAFPASCNADDTRTSPRFLTVSVHLSPS